MREMEAEMKTRVRKDFQDTIAQPAIWSGGIHPHYIKAGGRHP